MPEPDKKKALAPAAECQAADVETRTGLPERKAAQDTEKAADEDTERAASLKSKYPLYIDILQLRQIQDIVCRDPGHNRYLVLSEILNESDPLRISPKYMRSPEKRKTMDL